MTPSTSQPQSQEPAIISQVDYDESRLPPNPVADPTFNGMYHPVAQTLPTRLANHEAPVFTAFATAPQDNLYSSLQPDIVLGSLDPSSELPYDELNAGMVNSQAVPIGMFDDNSTFPLATHAQTARQPFVPNWEVEQYRNMSNSFMTLPQEMPFVSTVLLRYYFDQICTVACTYDGPKNPFRTFLSARWQDSAVAFTSAQGIAAAAMARQTPELRPLAMRARSEASATLAAEIKTVMSSRLPKLNEILVAVLLMGVSSTWLDPDDCGLKFYAVATALMKLRLKRATREGTSANNEAFFEQALTYWWMLLSLMVAVPENKLEFPPHLVGPHPLKGMSPQEGASLPHPWAGVSTEAQVLLGTVASHAHSLRSRRKRALQVDATVMGITADDDVLSDFVLTVTARDLEQRTWNLSRRGRDDIADPMDPEADVGEFVTVNEAYKSAILILLYRTFPQLCSDDDARRPSDSGPELHPQGQGPGLDLGLDDEVDDGDDDDDDDGDDGESDGHDDNNDGGARVSSESPPQGIHSAPDLFHMAVHVLEMLSRFKKYSRILGLTPHLLIIAAGELRIHSDSSFYPAKLETPCCTFQSRPASVTDLRRFVLEFIDKIMKFFFFLHLERMRATVIESWRRADLGQKDNFWVDVMRDMGWQAVMG